MTKKEIMNKTITKQEFVDALRENRPCQWSEIPDIDLYMDQVISFMERQHIGLQFDESLTPSMINNYIKLGVMPKAVGKRYGREHIAYLTFICVLKQIIGINQIGQLISRVLEEEKLSISQLYDIFINILDKELTKQWGLNKDIIQGEYSMLTADFFNEEAFKDDGKSVAMRSFRLAIEGYTRSFVCSNLLKLD